MTPVVQLKVGNVIRPVRVLNRTMAANWLYGGECADIGGGIVAGAEMAIVELSVLPGKAWVRVAIPERDPPAYLKIAGGELSSNFDFVR